MVRVAELEVHWKQRSSPEKTVRAKVERKETILCALMLKFGKEGE